MNQDVCGKNSKKSRPCKIKRYDRSLKRFFSDPWVLLHLLAALGFSLAVSVIFIHILVTWEQHKLRYIHHDAFPLEQSFQERVIAKYGAEKFYGLYLDGKLRVNTSIYVW